MISIGASLALAVFPWTPLPQDSRNADWGGSAIVRSADTDRTDDVAPEEWDAFVESLGADEERSFDLDGSIPVQRLLAVARELEPGEEVEIEYLRDDEAMVTTVEPRDLSDAWGRDVSIAIPRWNQDFSRDLERGLDALRFRGRSDALPGAGSLRIWGPGASLYGGVSGLDLVAVNPGLGAYFGTDEGVLVSGVDRRSGLGLQEGDVVMRIGSREVTDPERFRRVLGSYEPDEDIEFHIMRDGEETTVVGRLRY